MDEVIKSVQSIDVVVETDDGVRTISFRIDPADQELVRFTKRSTTEYKERFGLTPEKIDLGSVYTLEFPASEMIIKLNEEELGQELVGQSMSMEKCSFVVMEEHRGQFTTDDVGKPILAFNLPIGIIVAVTEDAVYGQIWMHYFKEWCRCGKIIKT